MIILCYEYCEYYQYITEKNLKKICGNCIMKVAVEELKESLKETTLYKVLIKILDWISEKLNYI